MRMITGIRVRKKQYLQYLNHIRITSFGLTTVSEFKSLLAAQYAEGTPVKNTI